MVAHHDEQEGEEAGGFRRQVHQPVDDAALCLKGRKAVVMQGKADKSPLLRHANLLPMGMETGRTYMAPSTNE